MKFLIRSMYSDRGLQTFRRIVLASFSEIKLNQTRFQQEANSAPLTACMNNYRMLTWRQCVPRNVGELLEYSFTSQIG
jgi:hypothetical protein